MNDPSHLIDLLPTFVEAAGANYPTEFKGSKIQPMEGKSLFPTFAGQSIQRDEPLCFEHHGNLAMREGRWKIVSPYRANKPRKWELYDMEADRTELNDLAERHPEKLETLVAKWQAWADRVGVQPWPFKNKAKRQ